MRNQWWARIQRVLDKLETLPFMNTIPIRARKQVIVGSIIAGFVLLLVSTFLGAQNRGVVGAAIGAISGAILGLALGFLTGKVLSRGMASPEGIGKLEIQLDQTNSRYLLGDKVSGQVQVQSYIPLKSKGGKIALTCQGTFSHASSVDTEQAAALEQESFQVYLLEADVIPPGDLRRGSVQGFAFNLSLPQLGLPTHHGYLCIIKWSLYALLKFENEQPLEISQELLVESQPVPIPPETEFRQTSNSGVTELSLVLPRTVYAEGETIVGRVRLTPYVPIKAKELRIVLLRTENTPQGDNRTVYIAEWDAAKGVFHAQRTPGGDGTTYIWLEGEAYLASDLAFRPTEPASYSFAVEIAREWRPSFQCEQGSTTWELVATVKCEGEPELHVKQLLNIHTCVPKVSQLTK
jgi:hypothetical protein